MSVALGCELKVVVTDSDGNPVDQAVVSATPLGDQFESLAPTTTAVATISQVKSQFEPYVTAIPVGTSVNFPNQDDIFHNVYSFSKAKKFQLPLYRDQSPAPVVFEQLGIVVLGCNIHDWMVAYLYVLETPFFIRTDSAGRAELSALPAGDYRVQVDHPRKHKAKSTAAQSVSIKKEDVRELKFEIALKPEWRPSKD